MGWAVSFALHVITSASKCARQRIQYGAASTYGLHVILLMNVIEFASNRREMNNSGCIKGLVHDKVQSRNRSE